MSMNETWLTVLQYAEEHEVSDRTVQRWLKAGKLDGATHTNKGWLIPASTRPPAPTSPAAPAPVQQRELSVSSPAALPQATSLADALGQLPAFLPLEIAARLLGIPELAIRRHAEQLGAVPYGPRGTLVVPARTVRETAGL